MIIVHDFECAYCESESYYVEDDEVFCCDCDEHGDHLDGYSWSSEPSPPKKKKASKIPANEALSIQMNNNLTPFEKVKQMKNVQKVTTILDLTTYSRNHQTLVIVNVKEGATSSHVERAERFVTSLNLESTIKADIMSASDGNLYRGLVWTGEKPGGVDANEIAKKFGFTQVLEVTYTGSDK